MIKIIISFVPKNHIIIDILFFIVLCQKKVSKIIKKEKERNKLLEKGY
jgi:hypothetical protein